MYDLKDSEVDWPAMLKVGDARVLQMLFTRYGAKLFSIINRIVLDREVARDLVQDVFYTLWMKREESNITAIGPYLVKMAVNEALMYQRKNHIRENPGLQSVDIPTVSDYDNLEYQELENLIHRAIALMPVQRRTVFMLSRFEQMTYAQIASCLRISEKSVEKHISKALESLRDMLKPYLCLLLFLPVA